MERNEWMNEERLSHNMKHGTEQIASFFYGKAVKKNARCEYLANVNGCAFWMNEWMERNESTKKNKNAEVNAAEWTIKKNERYFFCKAKP